MLQQPKLIPHVCCPICNKPNRIDHLKKGDHLIWWCDCGQQYEWDYLLDGSLDVRSTGKKKSKYQSLLKMRPVKELMLIVDVDYSEDGDLEYWFNEHTCPTNFTKDIHTIVADGDFDPHGIFEHVKTIPWNNDDKAKLEDFK